MDEQVEDKKKIVSILLDSERACLQDLRNVISGWSDVVAKQIIWKAREVLRKDYGIVFVPMSGTPGYITRANPKQILRRGSTFRATAGCKAVRGLQLFRLAASKTDDEVERDRIERAAEREEERQAFRRRRKF